MVLLLLTLVAVTCIMVACGGGQKSLAEKIYDAYKNGDQNYPYLMEELYKLPAAEQQATMDELQQLMAADETPDVG